MRELVMDSDFVERVMAASHAIVLFMDRDGRIVLFNDYMRDLCGYTLDEVRGRDWFEQFIPEPERARLRELYAAALHETSIQANVNSIVTRSGALRQIEWWGNTVHDERGEVIGVVTKPSGMGLGLPLAREIVQAHAGELRYRSEPGGGTTFIVTIPCAGSS